MWKELQTYTNLSIEASEIIYRDLLQLFRNNYGRLVSTEDMQKKFLLSEGSLVAVINKVRKTLKDTGFTVYTVLAHNAYFYHARQSDGTIKLMDYYPELRASLVPDAAGLMDFALTTSRTNGRGKEDVLNLPFRDMELQIVGTLAGRFGQKVSYDDIIRTCYDGEHLRYILSDPFEHENAMTSIRGAVSRARDSLEQFEGGKYEITGVYGEGYVLSAQVP